MYRHRLFLVHVPCVVACEVHVPFAVGFGTCTCLAGSWYMYQGWLSHPCLVILGVLASDLGRAAGERAATFLCWESGYGASLCAFCRLIARGLTSRPVNKCVHFHGNKLKLDFPIPPFVIPPFSFSQGGALPADVGRISPALLPPLSDAHARPLPSDLRVNQRGLRRLHADRRRSGSARVRDLEEDQVSYKFIGAPSVRALSAKLIACPYMM